MKKKGFSLIELSVVITVIAIITAAALSLSTTSANNEKIAITNQRINQIYQAMGIYTAKNGFLPCPAPLNITKTNANYGTAGYSPSASGGAGAVIGCASAPSTNGSGFYQSNNYSQLYMGAVPTKTLNLPVDLAEDGFGNKFSYVILQGFTNPAYFGYNNTYTTTIPDLSRRIRIHRKISSSTPTELTDSPFVIISHGPNGYGAWPANSTIQNPASPLTEESWNYITGNIDNPTGRADFAFYDTRYSFLASYNDKGFDDILFYKSRNEMIRDFRTPHLLACGISGSTPRTSGGVSFTWTYADASVKYREIAPANSATQCTNSAGVKYPTRRCGLFGAWESYIINECS